MSSIIGYFLRHLLLVCLLNPVSYLFYGHESHFKPPNNSDNSHPYRRHNNKALFVFGDSLFDSGNCIYLDPSVTSNTVASGSQNWPYGETFFHYATGRLSDGRIIPDFICKFANLLMLAPFLQPGPHNFTDGTNFAAAGSAVLPEMTTDIGLSLPMQLNNFKAVNELLQKQLGVVEAKSLLGRAVYLITIGGIDYTMFYTDCADACTESSLQRNFVGMVIGNLTIFLKEIYDLGGRKIAFQNLGPLGCEPNSKQTFNSSGGCVQQLSDLAALHNTALAILLNKLEIELPGFKYAIFDFHSEIQNRVNDPAKYGFKDSVDACCGSGTYWGAMDCGTISNGTREFELCSNPNDHLWFDGGHTTEAANYQLAELFWSGTSNVTGPKYNVKQLFDEY